jgi:hypothetical protein
MFMVLRVQDERLGFRGLGLGNLVYGSEVRVYLGFRVQGSGLRVWGVGLRMW